MKRPDISVDQHNLLVYVGSGIGWIIIGLLYFVTGNEIVKMVQIGLSCLMIAIMICVFMGKHEKNDEMTLAYHHEAFTLGFHVMVIACLLLLIVDNCFEVKIPFQVEGNVLIGLGFLSAGWKFCQLERDGE
ncbi:hypothetical protein [Selenomonas ruminantium]|uniref:Uncharacterized protein n=1 Tax=Selenomonas ruminantium TaxID=971 RepID=A0A1K1N6B4_SELRU|nr:hypothetical protein [Selenomonas ruminantium]SFW30789.1 hypothetical protein SAMN02910323_1199 [Selenomonas ruminantium]